MSVLVSRVFHALPGPGQPWWGLCHRQAEPAAGSPGPSFEGIGAGYALLTFILRPVVMEEQR